MNWLRWQSISGSFCKRVFSCPQALASMNMASYQMPKNVGGYTFRILVYQILLILGERKLSIGSKVLFCKSKTAVRITFKILTGIWDCQQWWWWWLVNYNWFLVSPWEILASISYLFEQKLSNIKQLYEILKEKITVCSIWSFW